MLHYNGDPGVNWKEHTNKESRVIVARRADKVPRVPRAEYVNVILLVGRGGLAVVKLGRKSACDLFDAWLSVHGQVNHKVHACANEQGLLYCSRILGHAAATASFDGILSRAREDDCSHTTKIGISDLEVENLPRDARDGRIVRAQVNPRARVCDQTTGGVTRKEGRILHGQRGYNGIRVAAWDLRILELCAAFCGQLGDSLSKVVVCDGSRHKAELFLGQGNRLREATGGSLTPEFSTRPYCRSVKVSDLAESCCPM